MANNKYYTFDSFQITAFQNEIEVNFATILDMTIAHFNAFTINSGSIKMMEKKKSNGVYSLMLAHNQMNDLPYAMHNETGAVRELGLEGSEGLAHRTCFVYDSELKMLLVESTKNGVTLNTFIGLIERAVDQLRIQTSFVIDPEVLSNLSRMPIINKLEFRIAKVLNGTIFTTKKIGLKSFIKAAEIAGLDKLAVVMQSGRSRSDSLNRNKVIQILKDLRAYFATPNEVQKVIVTGKESEEQLQQSLDILSGKMRFKIRMEVKRNYSNLEIMAKCALVVEKFNDKRAILKAVYLQDGNQN